MNNTLYGFQVINIPGTVSTTPSTNKKNYTELLKILSSDKNVILSYNGKNMFLSKKDVRNYTYQGKKTFSINLGLQAMYDSVSETTKLYNSAITVNEDGVTTLSYTDTNIGGGGGSSFEKYTFVPSGNATWDGSSKKWSVTLTKAETELLLEKGYSQDVLLVLSVTLPTSAGDSAVGFEAIAIGQDAERITGIYGESTYITAGDYMVRAVIVPTYDESEDPEITGGSIDLTPYTLTQVS